MKHDIVFLNEIKTNCPLSIPGYNVFTSNNCIAQRGGVCLCIKSYLMNFVKSIDTSCVDQVWLQFVFAPELFICGCYIAPSDSPYFSESSFSSIQERLIDGGKRYVILGDFNSRCGKSVQKLLDGNSDRTLEYGSVVDDVPRPNSNGNKLLQMCRDIGGVIVNNLQTETRNFQSSLTFRRRHTWISELDLCIISKEDIVCATNLTINKDVNMPSDHAPLSIEIDLTKSGSSIVEELRDRAKYLGCPDIMDVNLSNQISLVRKGVHLSDIDQVVLSAKLLECDLPVITNVESAAEYTSETIYRCVITCPKKPTLGSKQTVGNAGHWQRILSCKDDRMLWNAINWKGEYMGGETEEGWPSEEEFKAHLEHLLNPSEAEICSDEELATDVCIPVLDETITPIEVEDAINQQMKPDKSCGPDGISPGVFRLLPATWILFITSLFNAVFNSYYPNIWNIARLKMLFKKGEKSNCDNYRGISVINSISKLYDYILCNRLTSWFKPQREQAGAQPKRGCTEHIVTLRLIMDFCVKKKLPLYAMFVDFSKAYDRVPRKLLMEMLRTLGCGKVMLAALVSMYKVSKSVLGMAHITSVVGVRQGSPTSCFLFTMYVDTLLTQLKANFGNDEFLGTTHALMLMDDTVILASSKEKCLEKGIVLLDFCQKYGMKINEGKTKLIILNNPQASMNLMSTDGLLRHTIDLCDQYTYLGSVFTSDGRITSAIRKQAEDKRKRVEIGFIFQAKC